MPAADSIAQPISGWASSSAYNESSDATTALRSSAPTVGGIGGARCNSRLPMRITTTTSTVMPRALWMINNCA
ncbi:hypothetical protein AFA91_21395 [Mycolicibacterium goodii]|uniref:Uncharacterized protein n=1 Tax=Mycolicibacterium goodii TaxID=134601 RepID=A0A0K0X9J3_MYCGD|nr:hypothetical protein AFA91_21395 [Mycolicibacterium goodii]